jgi:methionine aminopeptidase
LGRFAGIGSAIETEAHLRGFRVNEDYVGHGIGTEFHLPPQARLRPRSRKGPGAKPVTV